MTKEQIKQWLVNDGQVPEGCENNEYWSHWYDVIYRILQGRSLPIDSVSACLPKLPDLQHKHDLNNSSGWSSHPDDCYLEGVEETYEAIKRELQ